LATKWKLGDSPDNIVLIYLQRDGFTKAIEYGVDYSDELKVWLVPNMCHLLLILRENTG